jgi:hypothetical protein
MSAVNLTDSDGVFSASTNDIRTTVTIPALGYVNRTIDFGLVPRFTIGDFVWRGDGVQGAASRASTASSCRCSPSTRLAHRPAHRSPR